jgi:hypothetical protein
MARLPKIEEPKFVGEMTNINLMNALNWYHQNFENKDAQQFILEYAKKNKIPGRIDTSGSYLTLGWTCRLLSNGNIIGEKGTLFVTNQLKQVLVADVPVATAVVDTSTPTISIQERLREKIGEIAGELEGAIDEYIESDFKIEKSPMALMQEKAKGMHANKLIEIFRKRRVQFDEVLNTDDKQLKEGYSNFTKPQLKKLIAYCDNIILDAMKIAGEAKINRKPRKVKKKTPEQLVSKMLYLDKFDELNLQSIPAKQIVGATQLWVYNVKNRKLGVYFAEDAGGFTVKGSVLLNYSESKSVQRSLRKPAEVLPEALKGGKIVLRNLLGKLSTKESLLSGRINKDTILLRVL